MNSHSSVAEACVCENWNGNNPSMVSFVGLGSSTQKQFWDWETNTNSSNNNNSNPYINPTINIFDCTNNTFSSSPPSASSSSSSASPFAANLIPYSQFSHYSSTSFLKRYEENFGVDGGSYVTGGRIGLNLGHRTYFSSRDTSVIDRLFRRPRGFYQTHQVPRCQAEGCRIDLSNAKHYHRRHKVCDFHSKATKVVSGGLEQRFCQQCSRFHVLAEFDEAKRSCRKRLADHNRRRRKPQPSLTDSTAPSRPAENAFPQVASSVSRAEMKEKFPSSSTLPLMMRKSCITNSTTTTNNNSNKARALTADSTSSPALSLGGEQHHQIPYSASAAATHHRAFMFNDNFSPSSSSTAFFQRENSLSSYHHLFMSSSNEASQSTGVMSEQNQPPEDLPNLLHLGQAMFEVELL